MANLNLIPQWLATEGKGCPVSNLRENHCQPNLTQSSITHAVSHTLFGFCNVPLAYPLVGIAVYYPKDYLLGV